MCITQHTGPTALRPIRRTKQLWLNVLLKDTSAATCQAGIRSHILATPELESNALDRSATTLHKQTSSFTHFSTTYPSINECAVELYTSYCWLSKSNTLSKVNALSWPNMTWFSPGVTEVQTRHISILSLANWGRILFGINNVLKLEFLKTTFFFVSF